MTDIQQLIRDRNTDAIITLYQQTPDVFLGVDVFSLSCLYGNIALIIWLNQSITEYSSEKASCSDNSLLWAIKNNHLIVVRWLLNKRPEFSYGGIKLNFKPLEEAVKNGHLDIVIEIYNYLRDKTKAFKSRFGCLKKSLLYAMTDNFYFIVKWILSIDSTYLTETYILYITEIGNLSMLKFLHKLDKTYLQRANKLIIHAKKYNRTEIVEWINKNI